MCGSAGNLRVVPDPQSWFSNVVITGFSLQFVLALRRDAGGLRFILVISYLSWRLSFGLEVTLAISGLSWRLSFCLCGWAQSLIVRGQEGTLASQAFLGHSVLALEEVLAGLGIFLADHS